MVVPSVLREKPQRIVMEQFHQKTDGSGVNNRVHKGPLVEQVLTQIQPKSKEFTLKILIAKWLILQSQR